MNNPLSKTPFLFLLIPLLLGILLQYYFDVEYLSIVISSFGILTMLLSYFLPQHLHFKLRWLFGAGVFFFIVGVGIVSTVLCQQKSEFSYSDDNKIYKGVIADTPQEKPRTIACKVYLADYDKYIVCYFGQDSLKPVLSPGQELIFESRVQPFQNMGNPDDFDYVRYMYDQGFSGSAYITSDKWVATGQHSTSLKFSALRIREYIMDFYKSLGFSHTEYSILSALTLGYQNDLTDDIKQGFRTTGTVHVLSVSGLHVAIIYMIISSCLFFIRKGTKWYWLKPLMIIILLWFYAFITGLPPSVVRASVMLTIFCMSEMLGRKNSSIHALYIAAFFILLVNPLSFFDIGFQLSFMSVLSILYLHPKASRLMKTENKYVTKIWQMFTLSLVAQLATFPICLYYFGTFPTYFFLANMIIVPLVSVIMYAVAGIVVAGTIGFLLRDSASFIYYVPVKVLQILVQLMTSIISFFESLPFALFEDEKITFLSLLLISTIILFVLLFFYQKKVRFLIVGLSAVLVLILTGIYANIKDQPNEMIVYNRPQKTEITLVSGAFVQNITNENIKDGHKYLYTGNLSTLILSEDIYKEKYSSERFELDNLVLTNNESYSLYTISSLFTIENVILDASLSVSTRRRLTKECKNLGITCHDVVENGAFSMFF